MIAGEADPSATNSLAFVTSSNTMPLVESAYLASSSREYDVLYAHRKYIALEQHNDTI